MSEAFDVIVIGGGPGGYVAAIRSAQLGLKVACIEGRGSLGGTCLNVGCIPSKTLLEFSEKYTNTKHLIESGMLSGNVGLNFSAMMQKKSDIVSSLTCGIEMLFKKNKVTYIKGFASFKSPKEIEVKGEKTENFTAKNFIIATGSEVTLLPGIEIDEGVIVSSTGALSLKKVPEKMVVIGAGVIGLELGSVYSRLGSKVTVVEFLSKVTPTMDEDLSKALQKMLEKQGITFNLGQKVVSAAKTGKSVKIITESVSDGVKSEMDVDAVLVAIGRRPFTKNLGLDKAGVTLGERGFINVDKHLKTNVPHIYAIGDVTPGPMLAHKAEDEGIAVAEILSGKAGHVNYDVIPSVIYTNPEVASVGKTESELKTAGISYKIGKFNMAANSRAKAVDDTEGFVKILADAKTDRILGCHIISRNAGDMIHEIAVAMEFSASAEDIARTCHAHPTLNEAIREAAMAVEKMQIHS